MYGSILKRFLNSSIGLERNLEIYHIKIYKQINYIQ